MITVTALMRKEYPITSGVCDLINETLKICPNMSLADFAKQIDESNKERAKKRLLEAEKKQLGDLGYVNV